MVSPSRALKPMTNFQFCHEMELPSSEKAGAFRLGDIQRLHAGSETVTRLAE